MKWFTGLILLCCGVANASSWISMKEAMDAFLWIKFDPGFPAVVTSESKNQISFQVFDGLYTIQRTNDFFEVIRNHEDPVRIHSSSVTKILKWVKAEIRSHAVLNDDRFQQSLRTPAVPRGYHTSQTVFQCKSDLPARRKGNGTPFHKILNHTWLQHGPKESFGMPNTDEGTYFGGLAHVRTPDSFIARGPKNLKCTPVWIPETLNESKVSEKIVCMSRRLSLPQNPVFETAVIDQPWIVDFDYHALERNCLMVVRFILECSGARVPWRVNEGIGGSFNWNDSYSLHPLSPGLRIEILGLRQELDEFRKQEDLKFLSIFAEKVTDEALKIEAKVRGVQQPMISKNLREICQDLNQECN